ncbi:MAG: hypothetical protein GC190_21725 [Alphaproteobacteria bacterium]|nr:hypothetical protein [Alphaproteobacteria bacterium]
MLRLMISGFAILCVAGSAFAETVRDSEHHFKVTAPSDWKVERNPSDDVQVSMTSPKADQTGGICNVATEAHPKSAGMSQAEVDQSLANEITDDAWAASFKSVIFINHVVIEKSGTQNIHGHKAYYVVVSFNSITPGAPIVPIRLKQYLHAIPGEAFWVTCSSLQSAFEEEAEAFQTVFDSFTILTDRVAVSRTPGIASLTLYARENFGGVSHVVTQSTPDLALAGWRGTAGSISVTGDDVWQVCEGTNYGGACRLVSTSSRQSADVKSARRLQPADVSLAVLMQTGGARSAGLFVTHH